MCMFSLHIHTGSRQQLQSAGCGELVSLLFHSSIRICKVALCISVTPRCAVDVVCGASLVHSYFFQFYK